MDLNLTPDNYTPNISEDGKYIDNKTCVFPQIGLICPCTNRIYLTREKLIQHIKCQKHIRWLEQINLEHKNYFRRCIEHEQTIRQQRLLIAELEKKIHMKCITKNLIDL